MIYRNQNKGYVAGIAAGLADEYGISVVLIRLLFILSSLFLGLGIVIYLFLITALPEQSGQTRLDFQ